MSSSTAAAPIFYLGLDVRKQERPAPWKSTERRHCVRGFPGELRTRWRVVYVCVDRMPRDLNNAAPGGHMLGKTPSWLKFVLGWIGSFLALLVIVVGTRYSPFLRIHAAPALLGIVLGMVGWLCVSIWHGARVEWYAVIGATTIAGVATFFLRRQLSEIALTSPAAVAIGAIATFLFCVLGMRRQQGASPLRR